MTLICSGISLSLHSWIEGWWILSCRALPDIVNCLEALAFTLCNHIRFLALEATAVIFPRECCGGSGVLVVVVVVVAFMSLGTEPLASHTQISPQPLCHISSTSLFWGAKMSPDIDKCSARETLTSLSWEINTSRTGAGIVFLASKGSLLRSLTTGVLVLFCCFFPLVSMKALFTFYIHPLVRRFDHTVTPLIIFWGNSIPSHNSNSNLQSHKKGLSVFLSFPDHSQH